METSILGRMARGDASAMDDLMETYGGLVWSLARRMCRRNADAEDAVQEALISLWRSAHRFDPELGSETTFVATVTRRRILDLLRRVGRRRDQATLPEFDLQGDRDVVGETETSDEAERVMAALAVIRPEQRQVLEMSLLDGLSYPEISDLLEMPLGTVKTHARRGRMEVRSALGLDPDPSARMSALKTAGTGERPAVMAAAGEGVR